MALQFNPPPFQPRPQYEYEGFQNMLQNIGGLGQTFSQLRQVQEARKRQALLDQLAQQEAQRKQKEFEYMYGYESPSGVGGGLPAGNTFSNQLQQVLRTPITMTRVPGALERDETRKDYELSMKMKSLFNKGDGQPEDPFDHERKLAAEFQKLSGQFFDMSKSYQRIVDSVKDPSAAGDLALIYNYMKMLDPGSVVREGEFATAQNAAGVPDRVRAQYNSLMSGERLAPGTRADFADRAQRLYRGQENLHKANESEYTRIANAYKLDPSRIINRVRVQTENNDLPSIPRINSQAEYDVLAPGSEYFDSTGKRARKR